MYARLATRLQAIVADTDRVKWALRVGAEEKQQSFRGRPTSQLAVGTECPRRRGPIGTGWPAGRDTLAAVSHSPADAHLLARALFEIRVLLAGYLGATNS